MRLNRRQFLAGTIALAYARPTFAQEKPRSVIIVGAGISGLAAARVLHDGGIETVVLESSDRIGGRVHTQLLGKTPVELGAQWIKGIKDNAIGELCEKNRIATLKI